MNVDRKHKLIRRYHVSDAALSDSQAVETRQYRFRGLGGRCLSIGKNRGEARFKRADQLDPPQGQTRQASDPTSDTEQQDKIIGAQANDMGGTLVRTIDLVRAKAKIGMRNQVYNIRRLGQLRRLDPFSA